MIHGPHFSVPGPFGTIISLRVFLHRRRQQQRPSHNRGERLLELLEHFEVAQRPRRIVGKRDPSGTHRA